MGQIVMGCRIMTDLLIREYQGDIHWGKKMNHTQTVAGTGIPSQSESNQRFVKLLGKLIGRSYKFQKFVFGFWARPCLEFNSGV